MRSTSGSLSFGLLLLLGVGLIGAAGCGGSGKSGDASPMVGSDGNPDGPPTPTCGQPGMPCCEGNACGGGGCCVAGICMTAGGSCVGLGGGTCNNGVCGTCGGLGMICCTNSLGAGVCTSSGTICNNGTCSPCGELGSACCTSSTGGTGQCKGTNAICSDKSVCMACGIPGGPCCPGNQCNSPGCCYDNLCTGEGLTCGTSGGTCQAGHCSGCGNANQACCAGNVCYDGLLCRGGACTPCGGAGQICCAASATAAACQVGMACTSDGVCARCGAAGGVCCSGGTCADGCCQNDRCLAASLCPTKPDGGAADAPLASSDGNPGTGGAGGALGTGGAGGSIGTGGAGGVTNTGSKVGGTTGATGGLSAGGSTTPWTVPAGCGDGVLKAPERCDDGNTMPFDGCSSDCQIEPRCVGNAPCTSTCGDGIVVGIGEECDDGNTVNGDGCSAACKVEPGFTCTQALGDRILVPAIYRDFKLGKPSDFEPGISGSNKAATGMVKLDLDADGKPEYASPALPPGNVHVESKTTFASWFRSTDTVNHATASKLALWDNQKGAYVNRYGANGEPWAIISQALWCGEVGDESVDADGKAIPCTYKYSSGPTYTDCGKLEASGYKRLACIIYNGVYRGTYATGYVDGTPLFFPIDDDLFSASEKASATIPSDPKGMYDTTGGWPKEVTLTGNDIKHNFSFTSEIRYWFKYEAGHSYTLDIVGDDDVWVFVNKKLAMDLGGIHTPVGGSVTLDDTTAPTFGIQPGNVYEVAVFQAERQSTASSLKLTLPGFSLAPSVCQR